MSAIAPWLISMVLPLVKRALFGLGIGLITYGGLATIASQVTSAIQTAWGGMGTVTLAILYLGGVPQSIGIILGAITARIAFVAVSRWGKLSS